MRARASAEGGSPGAAGFPHPVEAFATTGLVTPASLRITAGLGMNEILLTLVAIGLLGYVVWLAFGSDDDNGGGGLMAPVLVPVRVRNHR